MPLTRTFTLNGASLSTLECLGIAGVRRGAFRLRPAGPTGRGEGCTAVNKLAARLRARGAAIPVPGAAMKADAIIEVRS
ncbi:hypothetical protein Bsp3421_002451 [Burkholderia sp. FERM BP-3421]|jgi:hypothetical protein|uniref:hypothetical protein n=1 Tax=Burkholderia sp. FERM BP-3421 TaxID=1494466 RepID=UPI0023600649|nr:hypothetical protein [Burkholderia sp. FERM BP-3421]WDD92445.1 hypothetical protein Bsp3421_002451 [Burkholderia sp. FERM BP-3421]